MKRWDFVSVPHTQLTSLYRWLICCHLKLYQLTVRYMHTYWRQRQKWQRPLKMTIPHTMCCSNQASQKQRHSHLKVLSKTTPQRYAHSILHHTCFCLNPGYRSLKVRKKVQSTYFTRRLQIDQMVHWEMMGTFTTIVFTVLTRSVQLKDQWRAM